MASLPQSRYWPWISSQELPYLVSLRGRIEIREQRRTCDVCSVWQRLTRERPSVRYWPIASFRYSAESCHYRGIADIVRTVGCAFRLCSSSYGGQVCCNSRPADLCDLPRRTNLPHLTAVIPGCAGRRRPGIHFVTSRLDKWIPDSRGACHRARIRATRWRLPE